MSSNENIAIDNKNQFKKLPEPIYVKGSKLADGEVAAEGTYIATYKSRKYDALVHVIKEAQGAKYIYGTADLDNKMKQIKMGQEIKVSLDSKGKPDGDKKGIYKWSIWVLDE